MNRKEIKELAKEKIKGNKWNIIWPILVIGVLEGVLSSLFGPNINININETKEVFTTNMTASSYIGSTVVTIIMGIIIAGYMMYILNFVRTGKFDTKDILETIKTKWLQILIAEILVGIIVALCTCLLIIPGIIMSLAYAMVTYLVIDTTISGSDSLKKIGEMIKGHN